MTVEKLIEALMALPMDMEVGTTNYYGEFGPVTGVTSWLCDTKPSYSAEKSFKGQTVALLDLDLDMQ